MEMNKKNGKAKRAHARNKGMDILGVAGLETVKEQALRLRKLPRGAVGVPRLTFDQTFGVRPLTQA